MPAGVVVERADEPAGGAVDVEAAARAYEAAELAFDETAQAERAQYDRWQEAFVASEVARDEADRAWRVYRAAVAR